MSFWDFFRRERWPHIFCPGCGIGMVLNALWKAFEETEQEPEKWAFVSGIGCTARAPAYMRVDSLHTLHGRAIAFATGLKLGNPELNVMVFSGDGDIASIGGNHLIHAARRNMDLKVIMINNGIYGMTGGQLSPTTLPGLRTTTTPMGNYDYTMGTAELVAHLGANFSARWTTAHIVMVKEAIKRMIPKEGFCFLEVVSQCPTNFGRRNRMEDPRKMLQFMKEHSVHVSRVGQLGAYFEEPVFVVGTFADRDRKGYVARLREAGYFESF